MRKVLCALFLVGLLSVPAFGQDIEQRKIDYLMAAIADLQEARFLRNGSEFDAQRAAEHLRYKLQHGCAKELTAESFIAHCATGSSITGTPYRIRFVNGRTVEVAAFLRDRLAGFKDRGTPGQSDK